MMQRHPMNWKRRRTRCSELWRRHQLVKLVQRAGGEGGRRTTRWWLELTAGVESEAAPAPLGRKRDSQARTAG